MISQGSGRVGFKREIRKLLRLGHTWGITVPAFWARERVDFRRPYVLLTVREDGCLVVEAFESAGEAASGESDPVESGSDGGRDESAVGG